MKNLTSILLLIGSILLVNLLSRQFFLRFDLTQDKQYTLSKATKNLLSEMEEPVMITSYFTGDLPQQYIKTKQDLENLLVEYNNRSGGMIDYEFVDPGESAEKEQEALQNGISPLLINVREKDQSVQKRAFMGAVIKAADRTDMIPFIEPEGAMEYQLTTSIKKISNVNKPFIALLQGHGQPSQQDMEQAMQTLSILYNVEAVNLRTSPTLDPKYKTALMVKPTDSITVQQLSTLDNYLNSGGNLVMAVDAVDGDFSSATGSTFSVGIDNWLQTKGAKVDHNFVLDASSGQVQVQQNRGFFKMNTPVQFPYFPMVKEFGDHPIVKGLEQIMFQFVSPLSAVAGSDYAFTPLLNTTSKSSVMTPPIQFDVQKKWRNSDFPNGSQIFGALLESSNAGKIAYFTDGDFPISAQSRNQNPDNISLFVNAVDYLSDDTGLIDLRTKGVMTRPIKEMEDGEKSTLKYINFLLPIALVFLYGFIRFQRKRNLRIKRMQENYTV